MNKTLTRRSFAAGAASTAAMILDLRTQVKAAEFNFKYSGSLPIDSPLIVRMVQLSHDVARETKGRLVIQIFPSNQLGGDTATLEQVRSGAIQMVTMPGGILANLVPAAALDSIGFSFKSSLDGQKALDGPLGAYIRREIEAKGMFALPNVWEIGMRQMTSSTHPIRSVADLSNFKVRTPAAKIWIDLFRTLGASPTPINYAEVYTALQTHIIDGTELPLVTIEVGRVYEVQKYLSITNHMWGAFWLMVNPAAWKSLPPDIQGSLSRNAAKYAFLQRRDMDLLGASLADKLQRQGMTMNQTDVGSFRQKLGPYYLRWKQELGSTAWALLENSAGSRLG